MMIEIKDFFNKHTSLSEQEWSDLSQHLHREIIPRKSFLLQEGFKCEFIAFVSKGSFRYYHTKDGMEKVTGLFFEKDAVCDYSSFITGKPALHNIESISESLIYKLHKSDLDELYLKHKGLERLGRIVAEKLFVNMDQRLNSFLYLTPEQRYEELIKRNPDLIQQVPQYMIASYLGIEPETLSRIRKRRSLY